MLGQFSQSLLNTTNLLWAGGALIAIGLLAGSINRRRGSLIDALRAYVSKKLPQQDESDSSENN